MVQCDGVTVVDALTDRSCHVTLCASLVSRDLVGRQRATHTLGEQMVDQVRIETVQKLELRPGDVLHITVGGDVGDGYPPWIPSPTELDQVREGWRKLLPEGVKAIVTHYLVNTTIVREADAED